MGKNIELLNPETLKYHQGVIVQYLGTNKYYLLGSDQPQFNKWKIQFNKYLKLKQKLNYENEYSVERYYLKNIKTIDCFGEPFEQDELPKHINAIVLNNYMKLVRITKMCNEFKIFKYDIKYKNIRIIKEYHTIPVVKLRQTVWSLFNNPKTRKLILESIKNRKEFADNNIPPRQIQYPYQSRFGKDPKNASNIKYLEYKYFNKHYLIYTNTVIEIEDYGYFVIKDFLYILKDEIEGLTVKHKKHNIKPEELDSKTIMVIEGYQIYAAAELYPDEFIEEDSLLISTYNQYMYIPKTNIIKIEQFQHIKSKIKGTCLKIPNDKNVSNLNKSVKSAYEKIGYKDFSSPNEPCLAVNIYGDGWGGSLWNPIHGGMYSLRVEFLDLPSNLRHKHEFSNTIAVLPKGIDNRGKYKFVG